MCERRITLKETFLKQQSHANMNNAVASWERSYITHSRMRKNPEFKKPFIFCTIHCAIFSQTERLSTGKKALCAKDNRTGFECQVHNNKTTDPRHF